MEKKVEKAIEEGKKRKDEIEEALKLATELFAADGIVVDPTRAKEAPCKCYSVNEEKMCFSRGIIGTLSDAQEKKYCPSIRKKKSEKLKKHLGKAKKWFKKTKGMPLAERLKVLKEKLHH